MSTYRVREATLDDIDVLVGHRLGMFADMGVTIDRPSVAAAFGRWLREMMPAGTYHGWVATPTAANDVVGGGGLTVLPWPPGPFYVGGRIAFVYNIFVERPHRRQGLARQIMASIHEWCRQQGIGVVGLNASPEGRPLYDALGYRAAVDPLLFAAVDRD
jgi:GNAT superfamily N-acetyltransferase